MNTNRIRKLLEAYYNGSSSEADNEELMRFFADTADVPADLAADAAIFRALGAIRRTDVPADLKTRIIGATVKDSRCRRRSRWRMALAAAASVAVVFAFGGLFTELRLPRPAEDALMAGHIPDRDSVASVWRGAAAGPEESAVPEFTADNSVEVTDSVQAVQLTLSVLSRLKRSLGAAGDGVARAQLAAAVIRNPIDRHTVDNKRTN